MHWLLAATAGLALALIFYALVRLRIILAPRLGERLGQWARWTTWVILIGLMVVFANGGLWMLRNVLTAQYGIDTPFLHEMLYAVVAFVAGFLLVTGHVGRNRSTTDCQKDQPGESL